MVKRQVGEVIGGKYLAEFLGQVIAISVANAEGNDRPDIAKDCLTQAVWQLIDVLMGDGQVQPVLPRFGENGGKGPRGEVLKLVDVQGEIAAGFLEGITSCHGGKLEIRNQQRTQEIRRLLAKLAGREVGDDHLPAVHTDSRIKAGVLLAKNKPHWRPGNELSDLVQDRPQGIGKEGLVLVLPEGPKDGVGHLTEELSAVIRVGQESRDREERRTGDVCDGGQGVVEDVFQPRAPRVRPDEAQRREHGRDSQVPPGRVSTADRVEANGGDSVCRVEEHHVAAILREGGGHRCGQVTVRVNHADAAASIDVLEDHVPKEGRLARARLAHDVDMLTAVSVCDAEAGGSAMIGAANVGDVFFHMKVIARRSLGHDSPNSCGAIRGIMARCWTYGRRYVLPLRQNPRT